MHMKTVKSRKTRHERKAAAAEAAAARHLAAARLLEKVGPATAHARQNALLAAGSARGWASPRIERARERGIEAAAPRVEAAADALAPRVDAARDKIVEEMLPRLVAAVTAAAAAAAAKTEAAHDRGVAALAETSSAARKTRHDLRGEKQARRGRTVVLLSVLVAALGAGFAIWKRSQPSEDPWAVGTGGTSTTTSTGPSTITGDRLSGGDGGVGLGAGTLASESTDIDTPPADGLTAAQAEDALASGAPEVPGVPNQAGVPQEEEGGTTRP